MGHLATKKIMKMKFGIKLGCAFVSVCVCLPLSGCSMVGHEYKLGDVWHPRLTDNVSDFCVTCRCIKDADGKPDLNCTSEMCPEGCTGNPGQSECCSICGGAATGENNPASTASSSSIATSSRGCVVSGHYYNHGDTYSSNYSDADNDRCQQCFCNDRQTTCRTKHCPAISCPTPLYTSRDCCRVCPDESSELDWDTMVSFYDPSATRRRQDSDCRSGGRYFVNGATWHPVIGPFGEMDCVMCKCDNGRIDCSRLKCPSRNECPSKKTIKVAGQCCPVCPLVPTSVPANPSDGPGGAGSVRCLDVKMELVVWKSNGGGPNSEYVQYVFENLNSPSQDLLFHRMMIKARNLENLEIQVINRQSFNILKNTHEFKLLGGTTKRLVDKFEKKETRVRKRCKNSGSANNCYPHIQKLENTLKIKKFIQRALCGRGERQID
ncbi:unnamed protein product, partial [Meganyctiphanes norvegica]